MRRFAHFLPQALYILVAIIWTASLTACASLSGYPEDPDNKATLDSLQAKYFGLCSEEAEYNKLDPADPRRRAMRDEIVLSRMRAYDIEFSRFQRLLYGAGASVALGSDLAIGVLGGLGAVTGGAATKSALSAASGGIVGAQGNVNKDLYYQKTLPALIAQMEANRVKVKQAIFEGLKLPDAQYPLQRAESDLADLNDAGSIPNAISNITQSATEAKNKTHDAIKATYATSASAQRIRAWLYSGGKVDKSHIEALKTWLDKYYPQLHLSPAELAIEDQPGVTLEPTRQHAVADQTLNIPNIP
jgi:hypothetical protein